MKSLLAIALALSFVWTVGALAQPNSTSDAAAITAELEQLRARVDELERSSGTPAANRLDFSGDLRFRQETINADGSAERNRQRIRARINATTQVSENIMVGFTLATGASNPVSANQSLDGGFSRKDIGFDRAYFGWNIKESLKLTGGKIQNPMFRPAGYHLIFDSDLNPEGLALAYDADHVFVTLAELWVEERSSATDAILYALQGGYKAEIGNGTELTVGGSYMNYTGTQGYQPFYDGSPKGNSVDVFGNLLNDYDLAEIFAQADLELGGQPLRVFIDYVENTAADYANAGYAVGIRWRRAADPGSWGVGWSYEDIEADAVIGTYADSDFIGGGTGGKGHQLQASYAVRMNVIFDARYYLNKRGPTDASYRRLQCDISFKF